MDWNSGTSKYWRWKVCRLWDTCNICETSNIRENHMGSESWWKQLTQQRSGHQTQSCHSIRQPQFHVPKIDQYGGSSSNLKFYVHRFVKFGAEVLSEEKKTSIFNFNPQKESDGHHPLWCFGWSTPQSSHLLSRRQRASCAAVACAISRCAPHAQRELPWKRSWQNMTAISWRSNAKHI